MKNRKRSSTPLFVLSSNAGPDNPCMEDWPVHDEPLTLEQLESIVENRVGLREWTLEEWFECKVEPYLLVPEDWGKGIIEPRMFI